LLFKVFTLTFVVFLTGCGFQPLLKQKGEVAPHALTQIQISPIPERVGQLLRTKLQLTFSPAGAPTYPQYRLDVKVQEKSRSLSFRKDTTENRKEMGLLVSFSLHDLDRNKVILKGFSEQYSAYAIGDTAELAIFSSMASERTIKTHLVDLVAQDMQIQLASFLHEYEADFPR